MRTPSPGAQRVASAGVQAVTGAGHPSRLLTSAGLPPLARSLAAVRTGDRIAQLILEVITTPDVEEVQALDKTDRGAGGFGSTGR